MYALKCPTFGVSIQQIPGQAYDVHVQHARGQAHLLLRLRSPEFLLAKV